MTDKQFQEIMNEIDALRRDNAYHNFVLLVVALGAAIVSVASLLR